MKPNNDHSDIASMLRESPDSTASFMNPETGEMVMAVYVDGPPPGWQAKDQEDLHQLVSELNGAGADILGVLPNAHFGACADLGILYLQTAHSGSLGAFSKVIHDLSALKTLGDYWSMMRPLRLCGFARSMRSFNSLQQSLVG